MARYRTIKPEFWTSEQVVECSTNARLLFVGLWNFCDDAGRHVLSAKRIKMEVYPSDNFTSDDILGMIQELSDNDLILCYRVDDKEYLQVTGWHHQRIDKPQPSKIPAPNSETVLRTLSDHSRLSRDEGNREEKDSCAVDKAARTAEEPSGFDDFWKLYPKRKGANPRWPAAQVYGKALKEGVSADTINAAASRYCAEQRGLGKEGTEYVAQAKVWLNQKRYRDYSGTTAPSLDKLAGVI